MIGTLFLYKGHFLVKKAYFGQENVAVDCCVKKLHKLLCKESFRLQYGIVEIHVLLY